MSTTTSTDTTISRGARVLQEGYGGEAWHGPDLKVALTDVSTALAFWRPAPGRHNIAEIAHPPRLRLRTRSAGRLSEAPPEPFVLVVRDGEDWYALSGPKDKLTWEDILAVVDTSAAAPRDARHRHPTPAGSAAGSRTPNASRSSLGITCHAVYHAGPGAAPQEAARGRLRTPRRRISIRRRAARDREPTDHSLARDVQSGFLGPAV